ncbi:MAG: hypothetical protein FJ171_01560 [Gammaproteobacteria bacterium]|nr:hypothetical protein [Gammaproteobacteria bacterium]
MVEKSLENLLLACRWLLAPLYLSLIVMVMFSGYENFVSRMDAQQIANDKILWYVVLHLTFVVSAVLLGVLDKISFAAHRKEAA